MLPGRRRSVPAPGVSGRRRAAPAGWLPEGVQNDWVLWHAAYDRPRSSLARRLAVVRERLRAALDDVPADRTEVNLVSLCAGDGRDVLPVLAAHPLRPRVRALLVETDPRLVEGARGSAGRLGLDRVDVVEADAGVTDALLGHLPADVLLVCGVFGNVPPDDVRTTVATLPGLMAVGGTVLWTRGRSRDGAEPYRPIRRWFADAGFEEVSFTAPQDAGYRVGVHRLAHRSDDVVSVGPGVRLFRFR